ncbi:probable WRKY transcription factor 14 [Rutidosis leptorrhynchoides]|uniref:probable WRKY transcription factor 14 n=1 Tax=Rutidosis leptorrhynchoides TaxID=125765 RepID=UPI003A98EAF0
MENNFHGDLADIFRPGIISPVDPPGVSDWQYFDQETQMIQQSTTIDDQDDGFGQPCFTSLLSDPLIINHEETSSTPCFFGATETSLANNNDLQKSTRSLPLGFDQNNNNQNHNNMFSKMLQISPNAAKSTTLRSTNNNEMITCSSNSSSASKRGLLEASTSTTTLRISSPRNPAIKRRKTQAKKVVCIPAPAPANSRPTGEVVPSDLWAWRKYGQKPIKGSPYPRGYYRCSSSKGCSARKQVERSKTDPNMLVITYTSEHNHPWPTQRNALAGSTRTPQPTKNEPQTQQETTTEDNQGSTLVVEQLQVQVKDELQVLDANFPQGYRPELPGHDDGATNDFFSGLGEIEGDTISMLLNQGFLGGDEEAENYNKDLDPFG